MTSKSAPEQLMHLVFGGKLLDVADVTSKDLKKLDVVDFFFRTTP